MKTIDLDKPQDISQLREKGCIRISEATKALNLDLPEIKYFQNS